MLVPQPKNAPGNFISCWPQLVLQLWEMDFTSTAPKEAIGGCLSSDSNGGRRPVRTCPSGISSPTQQLPASTPRAETPQGHPREKCAAHASCSLRSRRLGRPAHHQRRPAESLTDRTSPPSRARTVSNRDGGRHVTNVSYPRRQRRRLCPPTPSPRTQRPCAKLTLLPAAVSKAEGGCSTRKPRDTPRPLGSRVGGWGLDAIAQ